jgi:hypothetical protein
MKSTQDQMDPVQNFPFASREDESLSCGQLPHATAVASVGLDGAVLLEYKITVTILLVCGHWDLMGIEHYLLVGLVRSLQPAM